MATKSKNPVYSPSDRKPTSIPISDITVPNRLRSLDQKSVDALSESMATQGLKTPITVRRDSAGKGWVLVAGWHRLKAAERAGWREISAIIFPGDEKDARIWEISENLHRAELTQLERSEHFKEWVRLVAEKQKVTQDVSPSQPHEQGIRKAARELGVSQPQVQRSLKIASITPEAKAAAVDAGLDDNQSALLEIAKEAPERQQATVSKIAGRKRGRKRRTKAAARAKPKTHTEIRSIASLIVDRLPQPWLGHLIAHLRTVGSKAHIGEIETQMRDLRPDLFNGGTEGTGNPEASLVPADVAITPNLR